MKLKTSRFEVLIMRMFGTYKRVLHLYRSETGMTYSWRVHGKRCGVTQFRETREWSIRTSNGIGSEELYRTRSLRALLTYLALHASL